MTRNTDERRAEWMEDTRAQGFEHRDWPLVRKLAAASVATMVAGLIAGIWLGAPRLAVLCHICAGVFGGAMLPYFFDDRLFVKRLPKP